MYDDERRRRGALGRIGDEKIQKNSLPAVPRRGHDAGVLRREDDFHGSGVNRIDSCLFPLSKKMLISRFL